MKSFLLIGQSNMAGRGFVHEVPSIYNERIEMLRNGRWQMMTEPINYDRPVAGVSSIDEWETEGVLFRHAVSEAKFAVENSELAGIHINAVSQRKFGLRYFEAYSERKHIEQPLAEEDRLVDRCHNRDNTTAEKRYLALEGFISGKISYEEFKKVFAIPFSSYV